jgi:DNA-binding response OmpR family regulator
MQPTVLIVDDEPEFVELVSWVLRKEGFGVESAFDGLEALDKARSALPDVILLDLMLPELDGTAVCEILRQLPSTAKIPILMVTGCATDACKIVALNAGVDEYLVKPCSPRELVSRVNAVLKSTRVRADELDDTLW